MNRVKDIQDKAKAAKVDKSAAKRFIKHALWQQAKGKQKPEEKDQTTDGKNLILKKNLMLEKLHR